MKPNRISLVILVVLCLASLVNASIYIGSGNGQLYSGNTLNIVDSSYNNSEIRLTGDSVLNVYSTASDNVALFLVHTSDNSVVNIISDAPVFAMYNLENSFWVYEDSQINLNSSPWINPSFGGPDLNLSRRSGTVNYWGITSVDLANNGTLNILVPEPASLLLLGIGGIVISRKSKNKS